MSKYTKKRPIIKLKPCPYLPDEPSMDPSQADEWIEQWIDAIRIMDAMTEGAGSGNRYTLFRGKMAKQLYKMHIMCETWEEEDERLREFGNKKQRKAAYKRLYIKHCIESDDNEREEERGRYWDEPPVPPDVEPETAEERNAIGSHIDGQYERQMELGSYGKRVDQFAEFVKDVFRTADEPEKVEECLRKIVRKLSNLRPGCNPPDNLQETS